MAGSFERLAALPGSRLAFNEKDAPCDHEGCTQYAIGRVVTEAVSDAVEYGDFCGEHLLSFITKIRESRDEVGTCDICCNESLDLRNIRDPEEGHYGQIFNACPACRDRLNSQLYGEGAEDVDPLDDSLLDIVFDDDGDDD